jgi:hypothetical protein
MGIEEVNSKANINKYEAYRGRINASTCQWDDKTGINKISLTSRRLNLNSRCYGTPVGKQRRRAKHKYSTPVSPWSRPILGKPTLALLCKKSTFHGARRFITLFPRTCYCSLSQNRCIHSKSSHRITLRSILISSHLRPDVPNGLLPLGFLNSILCALIISPIIHMCVYEHNFMGQHCKSQRDDTVHSAQGQTTGRITEESEFTSRSE